MDAHACSWTEKTLPAWSQCYLADCEEISKWLGHLFWVHSDKAVMHPVAYAALLTGSTALSDFIFMMGEHKIHPPTMYIKRVTQISSTHCTTFNMPTRPSRAPWTIPIWLSSLCRLQVKPLELKFLMRRDGYIKEHKGTSKLEKERNIPSPSTHFPQSKVSRILLPWVHSNPLTSSVIF